METEYYAHIKYKDEQEKEIKKIKKGMIFVMRICVVYYDFIICGNKTISRNCHCQNHTHRSRKQNITNMYSIAFAKIHIHSNQPNIYISLTKLIVNYTRSR